MASHATTLATERQRLEFNNGCLLRPEWIWIGETVPIYIFTYLSIYLLYLCIHLFIYSSTYLFIYLFNLFIYFQIDISYLSQICKPLNPFNPATGATSCFRACRCALCGRGSRGTAGGSGGSSQPRRACGAVKNAGSTNKKKG